MDKIDRARKYRAKQKKLVISTYGNVCECCGISDIDLLSIDHINGNGNKHRKDIGVSAGGNFYTWLINNNYPAGFRVLCYNCNCSLGHNGYCPHKQTQIINTNMKFF
jgi:hypothetical protein